MWGQITLNAALEKNVLSPNTRKNLTLQTVEDGEHVNENHSSWAKGEKARRPRQSQQDGEAGHRPQVPQRQLAVLWQLVCSHLLDLDQDHDEDADVAKQDEDNEGHHRHVEEGIVLQPAAGGNQMFGYKLLKFLQLQNNWTAFTYNCSVKLRPTAISADRAFP